MVEAEDNTLSTKAGVMDICANIYPMALDVQDIELTGGSDGNDWLMVFDPSTQLIRLCIGTKRFMRMTRMKSLSPVLVGVLTT